MNPVFYALLILAIGTTACWRPDTEPQELPGQGDAPSATPRVVDSPTAVSNLIGGYSTPVPAATSGPVPDSTAVANIPPPTSAATAPAGPRPTATATATSAPKPTSTAAVTPSPASPEDNERHNSFMENFKSISYEASLEMPSRISDCGCPVTADASGWMMNNGQSQMFARIAMTEPVNRSFEIVTLNSFSIYLKDLDEGSWYFIPENSDTFTGPLEDIMSLPFYALFFGVAPPGELEPVQDGYVWNIEDPFWGLITATYDQSYVLTGITRADAKGQEILRASFFDLNKPHDILPHEKGGLLPDTYWESQ